jgi:hypothetical protein
MKNVVDVLVFELAGHDDSRVHQRDFRHLFQLVQIRLHGCGGVSHGLGGTNKLLVCHETISSIGIIFNDVVGGRWQVGCRNAVSCKDSSQIRGILPDANSQGFCLNSREYPGTFANRSHPFAD